MRSSQSMRKHTSSFEEKQTRLREKEKEKGAAPLLATLRPLRIALEKEARLCINRKQGNEQENEQCCIARSKACRASARPTPEGGLKARTICRHTGLAGFTRCTRFQPAWQESTRKSMPHQLMGRRPCPQRRGERTKPYVPQPQRGGAED